MNKVNVSSGAVCVFMNNFFKGAVYAYINKVKVSKIKVSKGALHIYMNKIKG